MQSEAVATQMKLMALLAARDAPAVLSSSATGSSSTTAPANGASGPGTAAAAAAAAAGGGGGEVQSTVSVLSEYLEVPHLDRTHQPWGLCDPRAHQPRALIVAC